jgi:MinD superfamily P-loop ATPase
MYVIEQQRCTFCGGCAAVCPFCAIVLHDRASRITERCTDCGTCAVFCPVSAINAGKTAGQENLQ